MPAKIYQEFVVSGRAGNGRWDKIQHLQVNCTGIVNHLVQDLPVHRRVADHAAFAHLIPPASN